MMRVVLDTNVLVSGLRSKRGTSHRLLRLLGRGKFTTCVSVPLVVEYEKALLDPDSGVPFGRRGVEQFIHYVCTVSDRRKVYFLWRPFLRDAKDDMLLELAVAGRCRYVVTFNVRDFKGVEQFGMEAITPKDFLGRIGELK
jgi:putative PIN family toxin of toxin-antitoxin system